jgi:hypothetical protein
VGVAAAVTGSTRIDAQFFPCLSTDPLRNRSAARASLPFCSLMRSLVAPTQKGVFWRRKPLFWAVTAVGATALYATTDARNNAGAKQRHRTHGRDSVSKNSSGDAENSDTLELVLINDVLLLRLSPEMDSRERRNFVRAVFAAIEGILWSVQGELLNTAERVLTEAERHYLKDESVRLNDKGKVEISKAKTTLAQRVYLVTSLVARVRPECTVDLESAGWRDLQNSLKLRDRLTHPKLRSDLDISDGEVDATFNGFAFFVLDLIGKLRTGIGAYRDSAPSTAARLAKALREFDPKKTPKPPTNLKVE